MLHYSLLHRCCKVKWFRVLEIWLLRVWIKTLPSCVPLEQVNHFEVLIALNFHSANIYYWESVVHLLCISIGLRLFWALNEINRVLATFSVILAQYIPDIIFTAIPLYFPWVWHPILGGVSVQDLWYLQQLRACGWLSPRSKAFAPPSQTCLSTPFNIPLG